MKIIISILLTITLSACANIGPKPWEKGLLAEEQMTLEANAIDMGLDDHIYFSKEGTSGGRSFAGGGCGCN
ncbi:MAG: hypothetical protein ACJAZB_002005 [Psychrosphaera sp.]|jgi:hypothetical protein|uniref:DUF4266 domain-containing protein n=2 Tax=Psychrosphaera TaxID=907197 RepID=A0ABU3R419_9GAMM|nr:MULTISPECIES: DUF4266 domain-containing protein [Psychrosphaera]MBU2916603.1 DUF4266 domain-containing protein [Psychrosphaera sp. F3M07]MDU0114269.1 DUF4266 domain-containing protein [Psychrosphaera aquimarina]